MSAPEPSVSAALPAGVDRHGSAPARMDGDELRQLALRALDELRGRVAVVGSLNADLTVTTTRLPAPGQTLIGGPLSLLPGGKSANQAVACGLLGVRASMVGAVGDDDHGTMLIDSLRRAGVDAGAVRRRGDVATGTAVITVDSAGENTIVVSAGANGTLDGADVLGSAGVIRGAAVLGLCLEVGDEALVTAAQLAREAGAITVLNPSPLRELPAGLVELTDVLVLNEHEYAELTGNSCPDCPDCPADERRAGIDLAALGVERALVTLGRRGCLVLDHGGVRALPALPVAAVDTTGCGDAFTGALLAALASGLVLTEGAALASAVAALAATRPGAQRSYPCAEAIRRFLAAGNDAVACPRRDG